MTRTLVEVARDRREVEGRLRSMRTEIEVMRARVGEDGAAERVSRLEAGVTNAIARYEALQDEERAALADHVAQNPGSVEEIGQGDPRARQQPDRVVNSTRGAALSVVERSKFLSAPAADNLDRLIRDVDRDPNALAARYVSAVADPLYGSAFWKAVRSPATAHLDMSPDELRAFQRVRSEQRAMFLGDDPSGGFAVPFQLDPTILLTSDGVVNPIRAISRVESIVGKEWQGITSEGVTVSRADEGDEADDNSPTLEQPAVRAQRVQAFVPFSIEIDQDWATMRSQLARLLSDAKDVEEAGSFAKGDGTGVNPAGVISTLDASSVVDTAGSGTFAIGDVYSLVEAVPPRFQPRLRALATLPTINRMRRFVGGGSSEPPIVNESLDRLLGKPLAELSTMDSTIAAGKKPLLVGDFSNFLIVDRIGMSIELIPHLFGENGRPVGMRGLYAFWRNSSLVLNSNAFRVSRVKA